MYYAETIWYLVFSDGRMGFFILKRYKDEVPVAQRFILVVKSRLLYVRYHTFDRIYTSEPDLNICKSSAKSIN